MKSLTKENLIEYLKHSRNQADGTSKVPPNGKEVEELISYLRENGLDPIIVGSVAIVSHLRLTSQELKNQNFRHTVDVDFFVSKMLPNVPLGWRRDMQSIGVHSWISPTGGYVDFLIAGHRYPDNNQNPKEIGKDPESLKIGWPVADIVSLFQLKLNSYREKDILDLVALARKVSIPEKHLKMLKLNETQLNNLELIKLWIKQGIEDKG